MAACVAGTAAHFSATLLRDGLAVLGMDYTIYLWHVLTHKVTFLWRFHLVHHVDIDMDSTTALRFHAQVPTNPLAVERQLAR